MRAIDVVVETEISESVRVRQLQGMFDVPLRKTSRHEWHGEIDIDEKPWNIGLIVGPSGGGKSTIARHLFADHVDTPLAWSSRSVIDDFPERFSMTDITAICQAVGFNTIPSWMKPYGVLSTGEKFRVALARRMLEVVDPIVIDEFTSVVDRQVAKIGCHAAQKYVRRNKRRLVAVTCHEDVVEWLQPDWVLRPETMTFEWSGRDLPEGEAAQRPPLDVTVSRASLAAWPTFAPFHYLTAQIHRSATAYVLYVGDRAAAFVGVLHFPHPKVRDIKRVTRGVTLPDWQGLGLIFVLIDALGAAHKALGWRLRIYPAHPVLVRAVDRSRVWALVKKPGRYSSKQGKTSSPRVGRFGGRPGAVFEFAGAQMSEQDAITLIGDASWPAAQSE